MLKKFGSREMCETPDEFILRYVGIDSSRETVHGELGTKKCNRRRDAERRVALVEQTEATAFV